MKGQIIPRTRVALLGAGYILDAHAKALAELDNVEISAICDAAPGKAKSACARYSVPLAYATIAELAASDCDSVHILLPPGSHIGAARLLVEAGKSVFIEKPMGLSRAECDELSALAEAKGVRLGVNHNFLFSRGYEELRGRLRAGELGQVDQLGVNWHFALPQLQFGPFDNWMLAAPSNVLFEIGTHMAAFVVDLVGLPEVRTSIATRETELPGGLHVFKNWDAYCTTETAAVHLSLAASAGHPDRFLRLRCRGEGAQLDFGRDILWYDRSVSANPVFESFHVASNAGRRLATVARKDRFRRIRSALVKRPDSTPFEESVYRSIQQFYPAGSTEVDPRHSGRFAAQVIGFCEAIAKMAGTGPPSARGTRAIQPRPKRAPEALVVGGTGFIGRRLVRNLCADGVCVRVLTRNVNAAAMELGDLDVELVEGSHGVKSDAARALQGIKVVYHLAKCEGKRWSDYVQGDIEPTRVLGEAAVEAEVRRFVYTGTIASYASGSADKTIDNHTLVDSKIELRGHYARSKATCEALLQTLARDRGLGLVIARPGIVIGPGTPPAHLGVGHFLSETNVEYWGQGAHPLPFVLAEDVAQALALCFDRPNIDGSSLLLTSPPLLSAREYVKEVARFMGSRIESAPRSAWSYWIAEFAKELAKNAIRHPNRRWPTLHDFRCQEHLSRYDGSMSEELLGWRPVADKHTLIARGIEDAVSWFMR